jgi:hypothetical protein
VPPVALTVTVELPPLHKIGVLDEVTDSPLVERITSSLLTWFAHVPESVTVNLRVTVRGAPLILTPVDKLLGEAMLTPVQLDTHDQVVEVIG